MRIIVNHHIESKYYKQCVDAINSKYPLDTNIDREEIIRICDLCIELLIQDFTAELSKYKHPHDIFQFMLLYSNVATDKYKSEDAIILMQMCRYVFSHTPKLNLSYDAKPIIDMYRDEFDLSNLFFITKMIDTLAQQRAIQQMYLEALNNQNYSEITKYKPLIINTF